MAGQRVGGQTEPLMEAGQGRLGDAELPGEGCARQEEQQRPRPAGGSGGGQCVPSEGRAGNRKGSPTPGLCGPQGRVWTLFYGQ